MDPFSKPGTRDRPRPRRVQQEVGWIHLPEIRFDGWTLRRQTGELLNATTRVQLRPQQAQVLEELLAHPGELVTREQLIARLWPKRVVDFSMGLNSVVRSLRAVLGDHAESPRYIETIPRRGYRFIGTVDTRVVAGASRVDISVPSTVPTRWHRPRWAVAAASLLVLATVATAHWSQPVDQRAGPARRVCLPTRRRRSVTFLPGISCSAACRVTSNAHGSISPSRSQSIPALHARGRAWRVRAGSTRSRAACRLSRDWPGYDKLPKGPWTIDPGIAEAHVRLAHYRWRVGDRFAGDEHFRKAVELEPDDPLVLSIAAGNAASNGRFEAAIELQRRAVEAEPLSLAHRENLVAWLVMAGRLDEAEADLRSLQELSPAPRDIAKELAQVLILQGRFSEALELTSDMQDEADRLLARALAYHGLGRDSDSDAALRALNESMPAGDPIRVAEVHAYRGESDDAFWWLQAMPASDCDPSRIRYSPFLKSLHSDPRWNAGSSQCADLVLDWKARWNCLIGSVRLRAGNSPTQ